MVDCHCVAGPGIGGALDEAGYAAPCGIVAQLPYWAGWPIIPVAGGATVAAVFGVWEPARHISAKAAIAAVARQR